MKQKFLLFMLIAFLPLSIWADQVKIGDLYYELDDVSNTAVVTRPIDGFGIFISGNVVIPPTVNYNGITYNVTTIGVQAFCDCSAGLTSITIPSSVTTIEESAFQECSGLTAIIIPGSVTTIGGYAFHLCTGLTTINIPSSVTFIGDQIINQCSGLTSITVEAGNPNYDSRDNCNAIIETATNKLLQGCKNTVIPSSVEIIGEFAFQGCSDLSSINIPEGVTTLGDYAFDGCDGVTSISIPSTLTNGDITNPTHEIQRGNLQTISVAAGNPIWDSRNNCNAIIETATDKLIFGCKNTIIPNTVSVIGNSAFEGCPITSIDIPNGVGSIEINAFLGCPILTIKIPSSVTSIGGSAFSGSSNLTKVYCESVTPPSCDEYTFDNEVISQATLYVPATSIETYRSTAPWSGFGTITSLSTVVTANDYIREYGDENPLFEWKEVGLPLDGTPTISCSATKTSAPDKYDIVITRGTETNTNVTYVNGTLTVTKAPLTIAAKSFTIRKGESLPTLEVIYEGFKNSETESDLDMTAFSISCIATDSNTPGTYVITVSGISSDNYDITFVDGTLTINPESSSISITDAGMATYCSEYDLDFTTVTDLKAYIITGYDWQSKKVYAMRVYDVPAATGLLLVGKQGDYKVKTGKSSSYYINMLVGTLCEICIEPTDGDNSNLVLDTSVNPTSFVPASQGTSVKAHRAYLQLPTDKYANSNLSVDSTNDGLKGDINNDGEVSVFDVTKLVNIILGKE